MIGEQQHRRWIVVGVDLSPESDTAIRYAAAEAERRNAGLRLLHVVPTSRGASAATALPVPNGQVLMERAIRLAGQQADDVPIQARVRSGDPLEAIIDQGKDACEIVLGHDPTTALARLGSGFTVIGVAAHSPVPVVAVPTGYDVGGHGVVAVGIRSPKHAHALLQRGFELAAERGASVRFVHAWDLPPGHEALAATKQERDEISHRADLVLRRSLPQLMAAYPEVGCHITVVYGSPARVLAHVSRTSDLLVLARRVHAFPRSYIGGFARAVLRHAACPVMIVPPGHGAPSPAPRPRSETPEPAPQSASATAPAGPSR